MIKLNKFEKVTYLTILGVLGIACTLGTVGFAVKGKNKEVAETVEVVEAKKLGINHNNREINVKTLKYDKTSNDNEVVKLPSYDSTSKEVIMLDELSKTNPEMVEVLEDYLPITKSEELSLEFGSGKTYNNMDVPVVNDNGMVRIRCTVYTDDKNLTSTGCKVREGILAGKKEWEGRTCILYSVEVDENGNEVVGEQLGVYKFLDTGRGIKSTDGTGSIRNGDSIDMWHPSESSAWNWVADNGNYVYMQFVENAVG